MKTVVLLLVLSFLSFSCEKTASTGCPEPQLDCSNVRCLVYNYFFDFRVVDEVTGADLVFGANPPYSTGDIRLFRDAAQTIPITLTADMTAGLFRTSFAEEEMYLVIDGRGVYKINADFRRLDCCTFRLKDLQVNGQEICTCCADAVEIPV